MRDDRRDVSPASFEVLVQLHRHALLRYAARRVPADVVEDLVSDVFLTAWRRRAEIPAGAERLWLFKVAANVLRNQRRGDARRAHLGDRAAAAERASLSGSPDPGQLVPLQLAVREILATLSELDQEALKLTEWDGLTDAEAAEVADCSRVAFRVRLLRARRRFASRLASSERRSIVESADPSAERNNSRTTEQPEGGLS